ncbi:IS110 family transposase [Aliiruegeria sabulilitoris]|uniref:IS110 family transposase n=1 Tax=Aliiruegeria sabulilitoris TaxID=1510458 RepID=UPI001E3EABDB|nr:IS110 family transposase [Aliiruegeria sabulilitoris]
MFRDLLREIFDELTELDRRISSCNRKIRNLLRTNEMCQRISRIEGIGPITATALVAAMGDRTCFRNGRQFAAWLGLVPKQKSSGGKARLFALSKRGDRYLRTLMIHGARAVLGKAGGKEDPRSLWITRMRERRHPNVVAVALANKNARIVWSILSRGQEYQPDHAMQAG